MMDRVRELLLRQAGDDACRTLLGDSSGFSIMRYEDWEDARRGIVSRRVFDKFHPAGAARDDRGLLRDGRPQAQLDGVLRDVWKADARGAGHMMPDAACPCKTDCQMIKQRQKAGDMPKVRHVAQGI